MFGELEIVEDVPAAFSARVIEAFASRPEDGFSIALSGGETARACYERLAVDGAHAIDWWEVDVYWGDERCVPADHPDSNQRLGRQALLERVGAANAVHPMRCEEGPDPYQMKVGELGRFDVVHLGMGPDGHTASLFPRAAALDADPGRLVTCTSDPEGRNPHERMTLTLAGLARARLVLFTVSGGSKAGAMRAVRDGADLPAARVRADRVVWLVDREAMGEASPPPA
ncbi:MAG: 6-phosphogluconolactonase [Acidimicrobiales bacterium]